MAKNGLALVRNGSKRQTEVPIRHFIRERPISKEWLFQGKDELGREGGFLRIEVTGLWPRRVGPFMTQAAACDFLESTLGDELLEALCNIENGVDAPKQACVVEGVPRLIRNNRGSTMEGDMENVVGVATKENDVIDICKNLTIEQILVRAYRELSPEHQAELTAISRRTGIHMNDLLKEALQESRLTREKVSQALPPAVCPIQ